MEEYTAEIEGKRQRFFGWLSEKDRRRYAAIEAAKLGHGGIEYIARILACDPKIIRQGLHELEEPTDAAAGRIRKKREDARRAADPRSEPPPFVAGVHGWRPNARRRAVDEPVAARVVTPSVGAGDTRQSADDPTAAAQT
jgi:hypothetical protein